MVTFTIFQNETETVPHSAGSVIFSEGAPGDVMYAIVDGEVEIVRHGRVLATVGTGSVFGEMALLDGMPRSASAAAKTACRVVPISEHRFTRLVSHNPYFALEMMRLLSERVRNNLTI